MSKRIVRPDGTVEIVQEGQTSSTVTGQQQTATTTPTTTVARTDPETLVQRDPSQNITHFQKLSASGSEAERAIKFDTEAKLKKYNQDVQTINNMQVEDPFRYQQEHGTFPRRGNTDIPKRGLSSQDQIDIITGKKALEIADEKKGTYRAV